MLCFIFSCFSTLDQSCEVVSGPGSRFKGKHSLDSDEEDEGEDTKSSSKYDILASDDVEGMSCLYISTVIMMLYSIEAVLLILT